MLILHSKCSINVPISCVWPGTCRNIWNVPNLLLAGKWQVLSTRACNVLKMFLLVSRPPRPQCHQAWIPDHTHSYLPPWFHQFYMIHQDGRTLPCLICLFWLIYEITHPYFSRIHSSAIILSTPNYLRSTTKTLNILWIKYQSGHLRTWFWRGQTSVNKPHSFGWHCPSPQRALR